MHGEKSLSCEELKEELNSLFQHIPLPPIHKFVAGTYSQITDIPQSLLCETYTANLFDE